MRKRRRRTRSRWSRRTELYQQRPTRQTQTVPAAPAGTKASADEQQPSGLGLAAQRVAIDAEAARHVWTVAHITDEGATRPRTGPPLAALEPGDLLATSRRDLLSPSSLDVFRLSEQPRARNVHVKGSQSLPPPAVRPWERGSAVLVLVEKGPHGRGERPTVCGSRTR